MSRRKLVPYNRPFVRPFRPTWSWIHPPNFHERMYVRFYQIFDINLILSVRSNIHVRSEFVYTLPATKAVGNRRTVILESLERSQHENGYLRQHSGYGVIGTSPISGSESKRNHFSDLYDEMDPAFTASLVNTVPNTFPMKRIYHICNQYESMWKNRRGDATRSRSTSSVNDNLRGPFPYVDDKATVLGELNRAEILKTRHRVNSHSHPRWAIRTIRRRTRRELLKLKRRSISQERIRSLQAQLISNKSTISD